MVDSGTWNNFVLKLILLPSEGTFEYVEQPNIVFSFAPGIPSEDDQVGFVKEHSVTVSLAWSALLVRYINYFPNGAE